jgi:hypothetical protein
MLKLVIDEISREQLEAARLDLGKYGIVITDDSGCFNFSYIGSWLIEYDYFQHRQLLRLALHKKPFFITENKVKKEVEKYLVENDLKYEFFNS